MERATFSTTLIAPLLFLLLGSSIALKEGYSCLSNSNCGSRCGNIRPRCTRIQPFSPTLKTKALPFNRYSWLTTHNAFAMLGQKSQTDSPILAALNQQDSITSQLNQPAINVLKEIGAFLEANPSEIVTIIFEDYVASPKGLTKDKATFGACDYPKVGRTPGAAEHAWSSANRDMGSFQLWWVFAALFIASLLSL